MLAYLEAGDALGHFHWNGNDLSTNAGREDRHYPLHRDKLFEKLHVQIKKAPGTHLLEHWYGESALDQELEFIRSL